MARVAAGTRTVAGVRTVAGTRTAVPLARRSALDNWATTLLLSWYSCYWAGDPNWSSPPSGGPVVEWTDGSGNGRHLRATGYTQMPTFTRSDALANNRSCILFDGATDCLTTTAAVNLVQPFTAVAIVKADTLDATARRFMGLRAGTSGSSRGAGVPTSNAWSLGMGATGLTAVGAADATDFHLYEAVANGASSILRIDGVQVDTGDAGAEAVSQIRLGASGNTATPAGFWGGRLAFAGLIAGNPSVDSALNWAFWKAFASAWYTITIA